MKIIAVIPARYESSRFPGKPLALINNRSMIRTVYENITDSKFLDDIIIATDDARIESECKKHNMQYVMTEPELPSGTDRIYQAVERSGINADIIVNVQGDEPLLKSGLIDDLIEKFIKTDADVGTSIKKIDSYDELFNPSVVKVVIDNNNYALYFSRSTIPFLRDIDKNNWLEHQVFYKHIGIYAYRYDALKKFVSLEQSTLEKTEKLEQLRLMQNGLKYFCCLTEDKLIGVDHPEDIAEVEKIL